MTNSAETRRTVLRLNSLMQSAVEVATFFDVDNFSYATFHQLQRDHNNGAINQGLKDWSGGQDVDEWFYRHSWHRRQWDENPSPPNKS